MVAKVWDIWYNIPMRLRDGGRIMSMIKCVKVCIKKRYPEASKKEVERLVKKVLNVKEFVEPKKVRV